MQATDTLMQEHEVILRVIGALEIETDRLAGGQDVRPGFFLDAADFIKNFADGCHHQKEEGVLFVAMVGAGLPRQGGPIPVMLSEHEQGRAFTRGMRDAADRLAAGDASARTDVVINARGYAELLRQHIQKENGILFPLADQMIPIALQAQVAEDFERVEHEDTGEGVHEKYLALAEALEREAGRDA
jgi:hemerythrin-like domain-containing protein